MHTALFGPPRHDPNFHIQGNWCTGFICQMLCSRIDSISKTRGQLLVPGEDPSLAGLWKSYWWYLHKHLAFINQVVNEYPPKIEIAIAALMKLMRFDLVAKGLFWQKHLNGVFAYIEGIGGVDYILAQTKPAPAFCSLLR